MYLAMTIGGRFWIEIEFNFKGLSTPRQRQEHLEDLAAILAIEYREEILLAGPAEFYWQAGSLANEIEITDFDLKQFDVQLKAKRFFKQNSKT